MPAPGTHLAHARFAPVAVLRRSAFGASRLGLRARRPQTLGRPRIAPRPSGSIPLHGNSRSRSVRAGGGPQALGLRRFAPWPSGSMPILGNSRSHSARASRGPQALGLEPDASEGHCQETRAQTASDAIQESVKEPSDNSILAHMIAGASADQSKVTRAHLHYTFFRISRQISSARTMPRRNANRIQIHRDGLVSLTVSAITPWLSA
jgi:hypothetical protein